MSRICKHWKVEDRRAKPGFVLISGNNHACPRLPPTCFPFSEPLMQTREPAQEDFSQRSKKLQAIEGGATEPCHLLTGCPGTEPIATTAVATVIIMTTYSS